MAPVKAESNASSSMEEQEKVVGVAEEDPSVSVSIQKLIDDERKRKKKAEKFKRLLRSADEDDLFKWEALLESEMRLRRIEGIGGRMKRSGSGYNSEKDFWKERDELMRARMASMIALSDEELDE